MGNVGGMRQVADTSRKRQSTERAGRQLTESRAIQKVPQAKKAEETLNEKKSRGRRKSSEKGTAKGTGSRSRASQAPEPWRKVAQGHLVERKWRLLYHLQYRYFVFEQFRALRLCRKFSAIDSAWRIRRDGASGAIPLFMELVFYLSNRGNQKAVAKLVAVGEVLLAFCGLSQLLMEAVSIWTGIWAIITRRQVEAALSVAF